MASSSLTPLTKANTAFSLALYKKISEDNKAGNVFYSPLSISSALAMVLLGARGNTATQISEVLRFSEAEGPQQAALPQQVQYTQQASENNLQPVLLQQMVQQQKGEYDFNANFSKLLSELNEHGAVYSLSVANRLYGEQNCQFVQEFLEETRKYYNAELQTVDFQHKAEEARVEINTWMEKQTQDKIKDLLKPGTVKSSTILVLVNAIYFKGKWDKRFMEKLTLDYPFKLNKNDTKMVKMMFQGAEFPLAIIPEANCQILEMPYKGEELSMLIFLPNDMEDSTTGLEKLETQMTYGNFMEWTRPEKMVKNMVKVGLPRFKMTNPYDMNDLLISMGMVDAFTVGLSDFSGMSSGPLVLTKVVHKAFVEVNEEGTEAGVGSGATIEIKSSMIPNTFVADHPFLFFIRHNPSKSILFAGRCSSPE
ncbi:Leukocyte elastase inhibitor [Merluccius polli]|uniref:Serpin B6 n=1 Tax=Merluccius polli TaxID=89951 RepID=A0AA47NQM8_MERPO|nr:Leukocyte elastase inhibitor [Merluccius polli]